MPDALVDRPPHYTASTIEVWDAIVAWKLDYLRGCAVKYLARAGHKPEGDRVRELQDLRKARAYVEKAIAVLSSVADPVQPG